MLLRLHRYLAAVPPVFLDGCIAVSIAILTGLNMSFATDDSAKYIDPAWRFWFLVTIGSGIQGMHALSKFRDRSYGHHMDNKTDDPKEAELIRRTVEKTRVIMEDKRKNEQ